MINYYKNSATIVAIATPLGRGGIGILRISGKLVPTISLELLGKLPYPRKAEYLPFLDKNNSILERIIAIFFPEPHSFTGENILEIHGHGGYAILNLLLDRILEISPDIRLANPGEFTARAFLNEKIDLIQAEAIADIIDATSYQAAKSASNSLQGVFSLKIHKLLKKISSFRVYIESSLDFSDQDIHEISNNKVQNLLKNIIDNVEHILKLACSGLLLKEGIKIVIAGKSNVGKSSLFNSLIATDRAIISKIPGTTRDTLCESIQLKGITCYITDTAGLRNNSSDEIELMGIKRTWHSIKQSDHIIWVVDSTNIKNKNYNNILNAVKKLNTTTPITIVRNKSDLSLETIGISTIEKYTCITLSALLHNGIDLLRTHLSNYILKQMHQPSFYCSIENENQGNFIARKRHLEILKKVKLYLLSAQAQLKSHDEIIFNDTFADDLKHAHQELNKILGKYVADDLLTEIFSTFCIGK